MTFWGGGASENYISQGFENTRQCAFTLAEVLITLGIIVAMTLPALIQRKQEKVTVTQLKKSYSLLQQVYDRMVYEIGSEPKDLGYQYENGFGCTAWVLFNENMDYLKCSGLDWDGKKVRQIKSGRERPLNDYSIT